MSTYNACYSFVDLHCIDIYFW